MDGRPYDAIEALQRWAEQLSADRARLMIENAALMEQIVVLKERMEGYKLSLRMAEYGLASHPPGTYRWQCGDCGWVAVVTSPSHPGASHLCVKKS